ncbi:tail fiber assembly protein [Sodalis endosymbiont of Spalangia cameroni]|uniref:tail fiber assembly protein n=1 Tax=Sodalis praecaptivus TaxID=1239307 RepID=UPI0031F8F65A
MNTENPQRTEPTFNQRGFVEVPGWMKIHRLDEHSGEYLGTDEVFLTKAGGLPAYSVALAPPNEKNGFARIYRHEKNSWEYVPDHRGERVYYTDNGMVQDVMTIGEIPPDLTPLAPQTPYDHWDGKRWVTDKAEQHQAEMKSAKTSLRQRQSFANNAVFPLQDAVDLDMATEAEKAALLAWKRYRVLLNRVDISTAPDIDWPTPPDEEA